MPEKPDIDPRFYDFVLFQAQNAGLFLGEIPNPQTGEKSINLKAAKSVVDSLEMLEEKSADNLTPDEERMINKVLDNVRALYAAASK